MSIRPPSPTPVWWKASATKKIVTTTMVKAKLAFDARKDAAARLGVHPEEVELSEPSETEIKKVEAEEKKY